MRNRSIGSAGMHGLVHGAVHRAIAFFANVQRPWGELAAYRHVDRALPGAGRFDSSPFVTTFVLHALDFVDDSRVAEIRRGAIDFLLAERTGDGLWRYWSSRQGTPIDPDLDDTCCASFALRGLPAAADGANVDAILRNRHASGLFKTWLRDGEASNDVDGVVNANVLLYLGERDETRAACEIVVTAINDGREADATWYYVTPLALYYAVARGWHHGVNGFGRCRATILERVRADGAEDEPMHVALRLAVRAAFGDPWDAASERWLRRLLGAQQDDGAWRRCAFYTGPEPPAGHSVWWGSEELTTAFCVEALARSPYYH